VPARLINIKYITIRAEKVASPVTALHIGIFSNFRIYNTYTIPFSISIVCSLGLLRNTKFNYEL